MPAFDHTAFDPAAFDTDSIWTADPQWIDGEYIGGALDTIWTRNQHREYARQRKHPAQPGSAHQLSAQANLKAACQGWNALTDAQRAAWEILALRNSLRVAFSKRIKPPGQILYVSRNIARLQAGLALLTDPATTKLLDAPRSATVTIQAAPDHILCQLTAPAAAGDTSLNIWATPRLNTARTFFAWQARLIAINLAPTNAPFDVITQFNARFGALPPPGNLGIILQIFHPPSGSLSKKLKLVAPIP